jgi:glycosyltransferase involved in cell wall biosynthesis
MVAPPLSVLMPARDAAATLGAALASIRSQTLQDFELVAVEDASRDETGRLLAHAAARDPRIRVVQGRGEGISAALNAGLFACRAPLIARMDADDVALPGRFAVQCSALREDPRLAAVGSQVEIVPREGMSDGLRAYEAWLNGVTDPDSVARECFVESPLAHPAAMIRAEPLRAVGGFRREGWPEDYALWLRLLAQGHRLANVPQVLLRWSDRPDRLTRVHPDYALSSHVRLKAHFLARGRLSGGRCIVWGAGKTGRAFARALATEKVAVVKFVDIDPRKIGRPLHGVEVIGADALGSFCGTPLVAAVGTKGARSLIRAHLAGKGWVEVEQFTCVG